MTTKLFNVRVPDGLRDAIDDAAEKEDLTPSVWAREIFAAMTMGGVTLDDLKRLVDAAGRGEVIEPHPKRMLALQGLTGRQERVKAECIHPSTAIKHLPFTDVCGLCSSVVKAR